MTRSTRRVSVWWMVALMGCGGAAASGEPPAAASAIATPAPLDMSNTECVPAALSSGDALVQVQCLLRATDSHELFASLNLHDNLAKKIGSMEERMGARSVSAVLAEVDRLFKTEQLQQNLEARIVAAYDAEQARVLLTYYGSDAGRSYAALGAMDPDEEAVGAFIEADELSESRRPLIARLRVAGHVAELVDAMVMVPMKEMTKAMLPLAPPGSTLPDEQRMRDAVAPVVSALDHAMTMTLAYMLRDQSDAELQAIVAQEEGPAARWFNSARTSALRAVMTEAYQGLGAAIGRNMPAPAPASAPSKTGP